MRSVLGLLFHFRLFFLRTANTTSKSKYSFCAYSCRSQSSWQFFQFGRQWTLFQCPKALFTIKMQVLSTREKGEKYKTWITENLTLFLRFWTILEVQGVLLAVFILEIFTMINHQKRGYSYFITIDITKCFSAALVFALFITTKKVRESIFQTFNLDYFKV